ncbi:MAG: methyltransferase [Haliea sp.]|uniref:methyltransferase n=1 Tax=Haliea sp. TaxID=1932666 RepID=UPI000C53C309|nr:methyltransferase [Haliea sp.]MBM68422.1 methyltransferase [Haliea sp.]
MSNAAPTCWAERFRALDALLYRYRPLWQLRPFHHRSLPWWETETTLAEALHALDEAQLTVLEGDMERRLRWLRPWLGDAADRLSQLVALPELPGRRLDIPARLDTGVPGRKWQQITAFVARMAPGEEHPVLEWCAGKGHLGRLLAVADQRHVVSLEHNAMLCAQGQRLAAGWAAPMQFHAVDVLGDAAAHFLPANGHAVALHACGDLHTRLMTLWLSSRCERLTLSPCCYDAIAGERYRPLSHEAASSGLRLTRADLQFTQQESVTGGRATQRRRQREVLWRLAFDEWQRSVTGIDRYLPLPAVPYNITRGSFGGFLRTAAALKALPPVENVDEHHWLLRGMQRRDLVRRIELVAHAFRRPLEIWLVLDRALLLQEQGADVRLGTFCDYALTPRNLLLDARQVQHA